MNSPFHPKRGSAMIIVLILSAVIAISLTSFLKISANSMKLADRTFYANAAVNLAENGLEEAVACYNQLTMGTVPGTAWSGWTRSGSAATRTFSGFTLGPGVSGEVKVYCDNYNPTPSVQPSVVAKAILSMPRGPAIIKMVRIKIKRGSVFGTPVVARDWIHVASNSYFDSWDSLYSPVASTHVPYDFAAHGDEMFIASASDAAGAVDFGGSTIEVRGGVASGGAPVLTGTGAVIQNSESPTSPKVDPALVTTDFSANFQIPDLPGHTVTNAVSVDMTGTISLPQSGDLINPGDNRYYYEFDAGTKIRLTSSNELTITDDVTLIFDHHDGAASIQMTSNNTLVVAATASVEIYTNGDITMNSNTAMNPTGAPAQCLIFGTNATPGGQTIVMNSNNVNNVAINAPNADYRADSNVILRGALVANTIDIAAYGKISYDESLRDLYDDEPYRVGEWEELRTAARRATFAAVMNF